MRRFKTIDGRTPRMADESELLTMVNLAEKELDQLMKANTEMSFAYNKLKRENDELRKEVEKLKSLLEADPIEVEVSTK